ncbi:MAG: hypothetical protein RLZZ507_1975 [Cyanobacteriota bacterium]|jgi:O-antigen/teichoic acid export membrane protein
MGKILKDILIYGGSEILLKGITAFMALPIYTRIFAPEDYGVWSFINTSVGLLSGILILGGDSAYARFFFEARTEQEKQLVTSTLLLFSFLWSGSIILFCLPFTSFFSQWSLGTPQYGNIFFLALLCVPFTLINSLCGQALRNQFRASLFTALNAITTFLTIAFSLCGVLVLKMGLMGVMGGTLLATFMLLPIRLWTVRTLLHPAFSIQVLRKLLGYGVPLVPSSLAYWVFGSSDRIVLGKLSTVEQVGLYAVANNATNLLGFVNSAIGQAWTPHALQIYEEQPNQASAFFGQVMTYILAGFGLLCVGITIFAREILMVLSTPAFYSASLAIGPLAIGFMAYASTQVTSIGISLTKQTQYFAIFSWLSALLNLGLNIIFVPQGGMIAASWSTAVSYIFLTVAYLCISQKLQPVVYEKRKAVIVISLTFGFTIVAPFVPNINLIINLLQKTAFCLTYIALLFEFKVLEQSQFNELVASLQKRIKKNDTQ